MLAVDTPTQKANQKVRLGAGLSNDHAIADDLVPSPLSSRNKKPHPLLLTTIRTTTATSSLSDPSHLSLSTISLAFKNSAPATSLSPRPAQNHNSDPHQQIRR